MKRCGPRPPPILLLTALAVSLGAPPRLTAGEVSASLAVKPGPSQELDFLEALNLLSHASTEVQKADQMLQTAQARRRQRDYIYYPDVLATGREAGSGNDHGALTYEQTAALSATINIYRFGGDEAKQDEAKAAAEAAVQGLEAAQQQAELTAALTLFQVIGLSKERDIARSVLVANQDTLRLTHQLYERGQRPVQEVEKVSIDTATVAVRLADAELALARAEAELSVLAGTSLAIRPQWPWPHLLVQKRRRELNPELNLLPERQTLKAKVDQLGAQLRELDVHRLPSLDFSTGYNATRITERDPNLGYNVMDLHERKWSAALVLTVPLFDRLAARTDYAEQEHLKAISELDLVRKDRELSSTLSEVHHGFNAALASALSRDYTSSQARKLYDRSLRNFRSGVMSANDLSLDQARLLDTELNLARGWTAVHQYFARLCHVLGRPLTSCAEEFYGDKAVGAVKDETQASPPGQTVPSPRPAG